MKKKRFIKLLALLIALLMPVLTAVVAFADDDTPQSESQQENTLGESKYDSPDINAISGAGEEPEELSVSAGATYQEKAWYEYIPYSEHAVSSYRLNDETRLLFYDPYTYSNSLIMDVKFDATTTEFDTMSSYSISHSISKSISSAAESTYTNTTANQSSGIDTTGSTVTNSGSSKTTYNHHEDVETTGTKKEEDTQEYHYDKTTLDSLTLIGEISSATTLDLSLTGGVSETVTIGGGSNLTRSEGWLLDHTTSTHTTEYSPNYKTTTKTLGDDTVESNSSSVTEGWTQLSDRVTKTIGSSTSSTSSWSETESTTVTKTYAATHFASDGVTPLPWAIVHYQVQMPMKCCLQVKYSGEWVTASTVYCMLTTVQGTCRAWMQNGQVYYEDWGNGEPVVATDFWSQFMTKEQLMAAYSDKLYPVGGEE